MASIASLVIQMAVDSTRIARGFQQTEGRTRTFRQRVGNQFTRIAASVGTLRTAIVGLGAAVGIGEIVSDLSDLQQQAQNVGVSFEEFQRLAAGLNAVGVDADEASAGIVRVSEVIRDAMMGNMGYANSIASIGLSLDELANLSAGDRFTAILEALSNTTDENIRLAAAAELLGGQLSENDLDFRRFTEAAQGFVPAADEVGTASRRLNTAFQNFRRTLSNLLANALVPLLDRITPIISAFQRWAADNPMLASIAVAITGVVGALTAMGVIAPLVAGGISALVAAFTFLISPIGLVVAAVAGLGIAFVTFYDDIVDAGLAAVNFILRQFNRLIGAFDTVIQFFGGEGVDFRIEEWERASDRINASILSVPAAAEMAEDMVDNTIDNILGRFENLGPEIQQALSGINTGLMSVFEDATDTVEEYSRVATDTFDGLADVITDFVTTGMANFRDFARSIIRDLISIQVRRTLVTALSGFGGGPGSFLANFIQGRQGGGPVQAGQPYRVGEQGPETFVPRVTGTIIPNGSAPEAPSSNITINAVDTQSFQQALARDPEFLFTLSRFGGRQLGA